MSDKTENQIHKQKLEKENLSKRKRIQSKKALTRHQLTELRRFKAFFLIILTMPSVSLPP